jgi:spermidine synthase
MAGLTLGAALGAKATFRNSSRSVMLFGLAEIWVALYAVSVPWWIDLATNLIAPMYGSYGLDTTAIALVKGLLTALILLPATVSMGATLPWLASWFSAESGGRPATLIYAWNTLGAAAGALLAGFILLPHMGFRNTLTIASLLDAAAGGTALWIARSLQAPAVTRTDAPRVSTRMAPLFIAVILSGWSAMIYEIAAGRIADLLLGPQL